MPSATMLSWARIGGHVLAQSPLQLDAWFTVSLSKRYSVKPLESVAILPNGLTSIARMTVVPGGAGVILSLARVPLGAADHQVPPTASPIVSPALASLEYVYIGQPEMVSC